MQNCDSGQVSNDSNGVQEDTNDLTTSSQANYNEGSSDLANRINGLYRLLDLCYDDGSSGIVDKIIISKEYLGKLCNDMVPSSFKSISEINYSKLNSIPFRLIGYYGNRILIAKLLLNKNIIDQQLYELLTVSINDTNKPSLLPGIYFLKVNSNFGLIIHWPEIGCYENDLDASSQIKRNMINLHRYLTKLTDHQICLMSDEDLKDLNLENSGTNVDKIDDSDDEYEVEKSQEEKEDFNIDNGFKSTIIYIIILSYEDDIPLYPIVVESTTNQSFVTRRLIKGILHSKFVSPQVSVEQFPNHLEIKLQGHYLCIDRNKMDINALELFVKHGLEMDEFLTPLYDAITDVKGKNEKREAQEINTIAEDIKIIQNMASIKLLAFERYLYEIIFALCIYV
ncbi:hypothetical protein RhiirB3_528172 [Rhizophagus irregularis]|nr:hypothetical protein RhiirB3_528172 [Rhizophagus irregularis]